MQPLFEEMKKQAMAHLAAYSSQSLLVKAMSYFLENFTELTLFVKNPILPIDNNFKALIQDLHAG